MHSLEVGGGPAPLHLSVNEDGSDAAVAVVVDNPLRVSSCARILGDSLGAHVRALAAIANALLVRVEDAEDNEQRQEDAE